MLIETVDGPFFLHLTSQYVFIGTPESIFAFFSLSLSAFLRSLGSVICFFTIRSTCALRQNNNNKNRTKQIGFSRSFFFFSFSFLRFFNYQQIAMRFDITRKTTDTSSVPQVSMFARLIMFSNSVSDDVSTSSRV